MTISQEKLDEFQSRMSNWVASQGLFFQLTHGGGIRGAHSSVLMWFVRMILRIVVLVCVGFLIFCGYLLKRVDFEWFRSELNESIASGLGADHTTAGGIKRARGHLEIAQMEFEGGGSSFFESATARGVRTKMGLVDGVLVPWNGETIFIDELTMNVKAGAEADDLGTASYERLFQKPKDFWFSHVQANRATIRWGYSGVTRGEIRDAELRASRKDGGWNVIVTGGTFSQNWLRQLKIERMEFAVLPDGMEIRNAVLTRGDGEVKFTAQIEGPASNPTLSGKGTFQSLSVDSYLTPEVRKYLGADLSGKFEIGGSLYASSGVTMSAEIKLGGKDIVELRDEFRLFKSISLVDRFRSYKHVRFTSGGFNMETGGGVAVFENVALKAEELMSLRGEFLARPPTSEEVDDALLPDNMREQNPEEIEAIEGEEVPVPRPKAISLREAAEAARKEGTEASNIDSLELEARLDAGDTVRLRNEAREREERAPRLKGTLEVGLHAKAFERAPELVRRFPIEIRTGLRWLKLAPEGESIFRFDEEIAAEILKHSGAKK